MNSFGAGIPFGMMNRDRAYNLALDKSTGPLWLRVWLLAISDANQSGHAEYGPGVLASTLGVTTASKAVQGAIRTAVKRGVLSPGSSSRCLVVDRWLWRTGVGSTGCKAHGVETAADRRRATNGLPF
ncbi:hypothetical protein ACIRPK_30355 [Kitasatospora sp. NPDC101801]|uniref:hypothetical protein n=1 Tax=Kitasatospora sp. NPDC101801 TaxID=3364103 RepID=UPI0037FB5F42